LVEFALVVGVFVLLMYGLVSFGVSLATKQRVTSAAADGARAAVGAPDIATAKSQAQSLVQSKLGTTGYTATYTPYVDTLGCKLPALCLQVTITYDLLPSPGLGLVVPSTTTATAVVAYQ
jgi:hypothetical protein